MEDKEDGLFWMSLKDYKKYYAYSIVCKYEKGYIYSSRKVCDNKKFVIQAILKEDSKGCTFSVNQMSDKSFKVNNQRGAKRIYKQSAVRVQITRDNKRDQLRLDSLYTYEKNIAFTYDFLPKGTYNICVDLPQGWTTDIGHELTVNNYSDINVELVDCTEDKKLFDKIRKTTYW